MSSTVYAIAQVTRSDGERVHRVCPSVVSYPILCYVKELRLPALRRGEVEARMVGTFCLPLRGFIWQSMAALCLERGLATLRVEGTLRPVGVCRDPYPS
jgi:hypothetical protein